MMLGPRLGKFKKKSDHLYNCRCPLCGDSPTNPNKARGYFYKQRQDLFFKCHNCSASKHFGTFLKEFDSNLYKEYVFERYAKGEPDKKAHVNIKKVKTFEQPFTPAKIFERLAKRLDKLSESHPAVQYCASRGIDKAKFPLLYVLDMPSVLEIAPRYKDRIEKGPPRLAIPFYNLKGELTGLTLRTIHNEELRYVIVKIDEDSEEPLVFGIQKLDKTRTVYVTEGAIDSLFLPNAIACNGVSFDKVEGLGIKQDKIVVVIDNEPRNKEVCRVYAKYIALGYKIVIWPDYIKDKDLNDMAQAGHDVVQLVKANTKQGLMAQAAFTQWRKC